MNGFNAVDVVVLIWLLVGVWRGVRHGLRCRAVSRRASAIRLDARSAQEPAVTTVDRVSRRRPGTVRASIASSCMVL